MRHAATHRQPIESVADDGTAPDESRLGDRRVHPAAVRDVPLRRHEACRGDSTNCPRHSSSAASRQGSSAALATVGTVKTFLEGHAGAAAGSVSMVALARSISVVLTDGRVIDTILHALATPLGQVPAGRDGRHDDPRARADSHPGVERERAGRAHHADLRPVRRPGGALSSGSGVRVPDRRRPDGAADADERGADGGAAGGRRVRSRSGRGSRWSARCCSCRSGWSRCCCRKTVRGGGP